MSINQSYAVFGLGRYGWAVAKELVNSGKDVLAVDNLNLEIKENELFSLLGVNGAGKTTTIKMLTGLVKATNGDAIIYGNSIKENMNDIKPLVDVSMQETAIARKLTVEENIKFL